MAMVAALVLAGCQTDVPSEPGLANYDPLAPEARKAECVLHGGQWARSGESGSFLCYSVPKDAGKACSKASDCTSACLARSRSCAPVKPLVGCNDILTERGQVATVCIE